MARTTGTILGLNNNQLAFLMARVGLGANLFFHGFVRIPNLGGFVGGMEKQFATSMLPMFAVTPMAYAIPFFELILGAMLILGVMTRFALIGAGLQMMALIIGCCFIQNWGPINSQMFLLVLSAVLVAQIQHNRWKLTKESL